MSLLILYQILLPNPASVHNKIVKYIVFSDYYLDPEKYQREISQNQTCFTHYYYSFTFIGMVFNPYNK